MSFVRDSYSQGSRKQGRSKGAQICLAHFKMQVALEMLGDLSLELTQLGSRVHKNMHCA